LEPNVIRLKCYSSPCRLIQQHRQTQRAGLALAQAPQKKLLGNATVDYCVHQQNVPAFQAGLVTAWRSGETIQEKHFPAGMPALLDITHCFAHKMRKHRGVNVPYQIRAKHKASVHGYDHIQAPSGTSARNLPA
jgi:hypothetical protein